MDKELAAYLDRRLAENEEKTRRAVEQATQGLATTRQLGGLRKELGGLREEFCGLREEFGGLREEFGGLREEFGGFRDQVDGQIRQTQVMVEDVRSKLETVAEGVVDMHAKIDRHREENDRPRQEDRAFFTSLFQDVKGRVDDHGDRLDDHGTRLTRLESARAYCTMVAGATERLWTVADLVEGC